MKTYKEYLLSAGYSKRSIRSIMRNERFPNQSEVAKIKEDVRSNPDWNYRRFDYPQSDNILSYVG